MKKDELKKKLEESISMDPLNRLSEIREYVLSNSEFNIGEVRLLMADLLDTALDVAIWPHSGSVERERHIRQEASILREYAKRTGK